MRMMQTTPLTIALSTVLHTERVNLATSERMLNDDLHVLTVDIYES